MRIRHGLAIMLVALLLCGMLLFAVSAEEAFSTTPMISASDFYTLALKSDGTIWAWGTLWYNAGTIINPKGLRYSGTPRQVQGISEAVSIYADSDQAYAVKNDGTVWRWGDENLVWNGSGYVSDYAPRQITGLSDIAAVSASGRYHLALKSDGTVWSWRDSWSTPAQEPGLENMISVTAIGNACLGVKSDGSVWNWGTTYQPPTQSNNPMQNPVLVDVVAATKTIYNSFYIKSDGTLWAQGRNERGQLGIGTGTMERQESPVQTQGISNVTSVAAWGNTEYDYGSVTPIREYQMIAHTLALKSDGTVWAWGGNECGQLGNDTRIDCAMPVQVRDLSDVVAIAAGMRQSFAIKSDGSVWGWGKDDGRLGNGSSYDRDRETPTRVRGENGWFSLYGPDIPSPVYTLTIKPFNDDFGWPTVVKQAEGTTLKLWIPGRGAHSGNGRDEYYICTGWSHSGGGSLDGNIYTFGTSDGEVSSVWERKPPPPDTTKYIFSTSYKSTPWNWIYFIFFFGWIWMWL